jgi:hypothetical protein
MQQEPISIGMNMIKKRNDGWGISQMPKGCFVKCWDPKMQNIVINILIIINLLLVLCEV